MALTNLGPDFVRAKQKGGGSVVVHKSQLGELYTAEPLTKEEQAVANTTARTTSTIDASVRAHEEAAEIADNERAALAKQAADARAAYETASLARRDAAAQAALDHGEVRAAAELARVQVNEKREAARKKSGVPAPQPVAADGRSPAVIDPSTVRVGTESQETMAPDKAPTSGETDRRLEREAREIEEHQKVHPHVDKEGHVTHPTHANIAPEKGGKK